MRGSPKTIWRTELFKLELHLQIQVTIGSILVSGYKAMHLTYCIFLFLC